MLCPFPLPFSFGYVPTREAMDGTGLELVRDHVARAIDRTHASMKDKPRFEAWLSALMGQCQELEYAFWQLLAERSLDRAQDEDLRRLARILGLDPGSIEPGFLRTRIRIEALVLRSTGTPEELLAIAALFAGTSDVAYHQHTNATATVEVRDELSGTSAAALAQLLRRAKPGGVRLLLHYRPSASTLFRFSSTSGATETTPDGFGYTVGSPAGGPFTSVIEVH